MAAGTFGGNYRLQQQRAACKEWPRGAVSARIASRPIGHSDAAAFRRARSGHAAGGRRRGRAPSVARPPRRDSQQRPSDRQRRSVHRPDDRRVSRSRFRRRPRPSVAQPRTPAPPFLLSGKETMTAMLSDLKHGLRVLARTPLFTICTIAALAIGIGSTTALFSVVHAMLLKPLPYPRRRSAAGDLGAQPAAQPPAQRGERRELHGLARPQRSRSRAWRALQQNRVTLTGSGEPTELSTIDRHCQHVRRAGRIADAGTRVSAPAKIRARRRARWCCRTALWLRQFGGDGSVLGHAGHVNGEPVTGHRRDAAGLRDPRPAGRCDHAVPLQPADGHGRPQPRGDRPDEARRDARSGASGARRRDDRVAQRAARLQHRLVGQRRAAARTAGRRHPARHCSRCSARWRRCC